MSAYIDIFEQDYMESRSEIKRSLVYTSITLLILFILLMITQFNILPAIPEDVPPLKSDEVIELFEMEHVELISEESGSRGGGTSSDAPIDQPQDQTERVATSHSSDFTTTSGQSNNHNTDNSTNPTSTTVSGTNYFGSGGSGGGTGSGNGPLEAQEVVQMMALVQVKVQVAGRRECASTMFLHLSTILMLIAVLD